MALIPTVSASPTISAPQTPAPQRVNPMAEEFGRIAQSAGEVAAAWGATAGVNAEASFQQFIFDETKRYDDASRSVAPSTAAGFADGYDAGFQQRSAEWEKNNLAGMSPKQQDAWRARVIGTRTKLYGNAVDRERGLQTEYVDNTLTGSLNNTIMPRAQQVAAMPDNSDKPVALQEVIADAYALIDAAPLSPEQKDAKKTAIRTSIQTGFAKALPPAERQRIDPNTPDETVVDRVMRVEGVRKNPDSSAEGPGQFVAGTWVDMVKRYRPDIADRLSRQEILDLRKGPMAASLGREMTKAYAAENSAYLKYNGIDATAGNIYLAHFLGPKGAAEMLNADPNAPAANINPEAAKSNPSVFYAPGDDGRPDMNRPRTAAEIAKWSGALMAGTYHTDWSRELDGVPYDQRANIALDGAREYVAQQTATQRAVKDAYDARMNDFMNGVESGQVGLADLADAYDGGKGWMLDAGDRQKARSRIEQVQKDTLALAGAQALVQSNQEINPFDPDQKKAVNLVADKFGKPDALYESDGAELAKARAMVERTQMIPDAYANALKGGLWSTDEARRDRAVTMMDGFERQNPAAFDRAFSEDDRKRVDVYRSLAPMVPADVLAEEMNPLMSPAVRAAREARMQEGRALLKDMPTSDILSKFDETWAWGGTPSLPGTDPTIANELRADYENLFAEAYARVPDQKQADALAAKWLKNKWGKTDIGDGGSTLMPYPPERYYPTIDGAHDWMDEQLSAEIESQFPKAQSWGIIPDPMGQTEADVTAGISPAYRVMVLDADGGYKTLGTPQRIDTPDGGETVYSSIPALVRFDYAKARDERRMKFEDDRARGVVQKNLMQRLFDPSFLAKPPAGTEFLGNPMPEPSPIIGGAGQ